MADIQLEFFNAVTGEQQGVLSITLPWEAHIGRLSGQLGFSCHGLAVVVTEELQPYLDVNLNVPCMPLSALSLRHLPKTELKLQLQLVKTPELDLRDLRKIAFITLQPGWRRATKEFTEASRQMQLYPLDIPGYDAQGSCHSFGKANVRDLAAVLLQAVATQERQRRFGHAGRRSRSWQGCIHALTQRSGLTAQQCTQFASAWLQLHRATVHAVEEAVSRIVYIA